MTEHERFWSKVNKHGPVPEYRPDLGPCWEWIGGRSRGYGYFRVSSVLVMQAYRYAYIQTHGSIPVGLGLDHLCRNHPCVNDSHLEPVTSQVNVLRGEGPAARNARVTHCPQGHEYSETNTYRAQGRRYCRTCKALWCPRPKEVKA